MIINQHHHGLILQNKNKANCKYITKRSHMSFHIFSQLVSNEKSHQVEPEQEIFTESSVTTRKRVPSVDSRSNRKTMFEQSTTPTNTHVIERVNLNIISSKEKYFLFLGFNTSIKSWQS
jgi:hypothetical protein